MDDDKSHSSNTKHAWKRNHEAFHASIWFGYQFLMMTSIVSWASEQQVLDREIISSFSDETTAVPALIDLTSK